MAVVAHFVTGIILRIGYPGIFVWMLLESACIPVPSELVMPFAGSLVATEHSFNLYALVGVGVAGNLAGSMLAYWVGACKGRRFLERRGKYILITAADLDSAERWFSRYGGITVLFTRVMPIIRTYISLPAGMARMPFGRFCLYTAAGCVPWVWLLAWVGLKLGQHWDAVSGYMHWADIAVGALLAAAIVLWARRRVRSGSGPAPGAATVRGSRYSGGAQT